MPLVSSPLVTTAIAAGATAACYTISTTAYSRDIFITNGATGGTGTAWTLFVATGSASVSTTSGMPIPPGGTMILAGGQGGGQVGSSNNVIYATAASAATCVVGLGSVVSNI